MSRRQFSPDLKRRVVAEHLKAGKRVSEVLRECQLCESLFSRWREQYHAGAIAQSASADELARHPREARGRIHELEGTLSPANQPVSYPWRPRAHHEGHATSIQPGPAQGAGHLRAVPWSSRARGLTIPAGPPGRARPLGAARSL